ncbi:MAG: N-6 DNA methylase [Candidatus Caldatribacterium sp.]|nr:N-6 DNA methylase [Candidatus Caldatribacterium sp.]
MAIALSGTIASEQVHRRGPVIRLEGGILGPDILEELQRETLPGQRPSDFGFPAGASLISEVAAIYRDARDLYAIFRRGLERLPEGDPATSLTRERWVIPLLGLLGYELRYNPRSFELGGQLFAVSHRAGENEDAPPVHIVGARRDLGHVDPSGRPRVSPHALLQEFLNRSDHLWGIVTNGLELRLLRKSTLLRRQAYVAFDLVAIFEEDRFSDFLLLFRLLHRSRLPKGVADAPDCLLEKYHERALEQGTRARDHLRDGVEECLEILANGFLKHRSAQETIDPRELYHDLLQLVYRFLLLLVAEERGVITGNDLYREHYGIGRLKRLVDRREAYTDHEDLWCGLRVLWHLLRDTTPQVDGKPLASLLGLPVLDGGLFRHIELEDWTITNRDLLTAFWYLVYYHDDEAKTPRRVNYAALDVEELGSVYESLLDNEPQVFREGTGWKFRFARGTERKSTGSYYTPAELVGELVKSALEPVLEERLARAKTREEKERAILSIRVLDPACGSGHFLLAATRRLSRELARVRTGEDEPSPELVREATRDVIAHCIFGVDKNPLAVELCKVALWIESCTPGKPLTFLDHRIKCGDSLVGVLDLEDLGKGIPDEAYDREGSVSKKLIRNLKKRNEEERTGQMSLDFGAKLEDRLLESAIALSELEETRDDSPEAIAKKENRYERTQQELEPQRLACDLWVAAFFWDLEDGDIPTTGTVRRALEKPETVPGNIRELDNVLERAIILTQDDIIGVDDLQIFEAPGEPQWKTLKEVEEEYIARVLEYTAFDYEKAAAILGISLEELRARCGSIGTR